MIPRITIPDDFPAVVTGSPAEDKIRSLGELRVYCTKVETEDELIERLKESQVVINTRAFTQLSGKVLASCPGLRMISILGTGTDNVDLLTAAELGITVTNAPGASALAVSEQAVALLFALARQIPLLDREVRSGQWPRVDMVQLSGKVMGSFGLGAIGEHVARIAGGLGMKIIAWTLHPSPERAEKTGVRFVSRKELLKKSDVFSLHLRLTATVSRSGGAQKKRKSPPSNQRRRALKNPGGVLLSHTVTHAVPSALEGLTSVFGMGTGVTPPLSPPKTEKKRQFHICSLENS